jgi:hypothetical protein
MRTASNRLKLAAVSMPASILPDGLAVMILTPNFREKKSKKKLVPGGLAVMRRRRRVVLSSGSNGVDPFFSDVLAYNGFSSSLGSISRRFTRYCAHR